MSSFSRGVGAILLASCAIAPLSGCGGGGGGGSTVSLTVPSSAAAPSATSAGAKPAVTTSAGAKKSAATTPDALGNAPATNPGGTSSTPTSTQGTSPPPPPSGHLIRRFTGTGSGRLGTIVVNVPSVLSWHAERAPIQIFTSSGFLLVQSGASNGSVRLSEGTYRGARVATHAGWSIELRTQAS